MMCSGQSTRHAIFSHLATSLRLLPRCKYPPRVHVSESYPVAAAFYSAALSLYRGAAAVGAASSR